MTERHLVVHTASPDGIPRPHLVPVTGLSLSVGQGGLGVVTWPGGFLGVLERASDLVRAIGVGSGHEAMWEGVVAQFVDAEKRVSDAVRGVAALFPADAGGPATSPVPLPPGPPVLCGPPPPADPLPKLPGAHGGRMGAP